MSFLINVPQHL